MPNPRFIARFEAKNLRLEIWINSIFGMREIRLLHDCISTKDHIVRIGCQYQLKERFLLPQNALIKKIWVKNNFLNIRTYSYNDDMSFTLGTVLDDQYMGGEWRLYDYKESTESKNRMF